MKPPILLLQIVALLFLAGCIPSASQQGDLVFEEKKSEDEVEVPGDPSDNKGNNVPRSANFTEFNKILQKNCISCHSSAFINGNVILQFTNEGQLLESGLVTPGSPMQSQIFLSVTGLNNNQQMPPARSLSDADITLVQEYITQIKIPSGTTTGGTTTGGTTTGGTTTGGTTTGGTTTGGTTTGGTTTGGTTTGGTTTGGATTGGTTTGGATTGGATGTLTSLESFTQNVYPITRANCISCHMTQVPRHASNSAQTAHNEALNAVNFTTISRSKIIEKMTERHNCGTSTNCSNLANQFQVAITEWKKARPDGTTTGGTTTGGTTTGGTTTGGTTTGGTTGGTPAPNPIPLATIQEANTTYLPVGVNIEVRCARNGTLNYNIQHRAAPANNWTNLLNGQLTCVQYQSVSRLIPISSLNGITSNYLNLNISEGSYALSSYAFTRVKDISEIPQVSNACASNANIIPGFKIKKLTEVQIKNILKDLFNEFGVNATTHLNDLSNYLISDSVSNALVATDYFHRVDFVYSKQNIVGISNLYTQLIQRLSASPTFRTQMEAPCASLSHSACMQYIVDNVTNRLLRGQLSAASRTTILNAAAEFESKYDGIISLIEYAIIHPNFTLELYLNGAGSTQIDLTDEELFHKSFLAIFNTIPTTTQLNNWYMSGRSYDNYISNLISTNSTMRNKFRDNMAIFFKSWLGINPDAQTSNNTFNFSITNEIPSAQRANFKTNSQNQFITDLATRVSLDTLEIRDIHFWDSATTAAFAFSSIVDLSMNGEAGLATMPPLIFSSGEHNNVFYRGAKIYKRLMCGDFEGITATAAAMGAESTAGLNTRDHYERLTPPSSSCFECHQRFNAIGYNLEQYDVIGNRRNGTEFTYSANGQPTNVMNIRVDGQLNYLGQFYYTGNANALYKSMYDHGVLRKCTTKQLGQYFLRMQNNSVNRCSLERINAQSSNSLRDIIMGIIVSDSFTKMRTVAE